jgi:N-acetylmuramoyl-L-alanine amidase
MATEHVVQTGDCLSSIAAQYGFKDYRTIYNHPSNASFKSKRPNPNIIYPGDVVIIPDFDPKQETAATDQTHCFVTQRSGSYIALVVQRDGEPLANARYELTVDSQVFTGTTDSSGLLRHPIEANASRGLLKILDPVFEWDLEIGALDPVTETSGVQARLNNLGFPCGAVDGLFGPRTRGALRQFQARNNLTPNGTVDSATKSALTRVHDGG